MRRSPDFFKITEFQIPREVIGPAVGMKHAYTLNKCIGFVKNAVRTSFKDIRLN